MPLVFELKCAACGEETSLVSDGSAYLGEAGAVVHLRHPGEDFDIARIGTTPERSYLEGRRLLVDYSFCSLCGVTSPSYRTDRGHVPLAFNLGALAAVYGVALVMHGVSLLRPCVPIGWIVASAAGWIVLKDAILAIRYRRAVGRALPLVPRCCDASSQLPSIPVHQLQSDASYRCGRCGQVTRKVISVGIS